MEFGSDYVFVPSEAEQEKDAFEVFEEEELNKAISTKSKTYEYNDDYETCLLDILDTAGQVRFGCWYSFCV